MTREQMAELRKACGYPAVQCQKCGDATDACGSCIHWRRMIDVAVERARAIPDIHASEETRDLKLKVKGLEIELSELKMAAQAPDDFVIMGRNRFKQVCAAERERDRLVEDLAAAKADLAAMTIFRDNAAADYAGLDPLYRRAEAESRRLARELETETFRAEGWRKQAIEAEELLDKATQRADAAERELEEARMAVAKNCNDYCRATARADAAEKALRLVSDGYVLTPEHQAVVDAALARAPDGASGAWDDSDNDENYAAEGRLQAPHRSDRRTSLPHRDDSASAATCEVCAGISDPKTGTRIENCNCWRSKVGNASPATVDDGLFPDGTCSQCTYGGEHCPAHHGTKARVSLDSHTHKMDAPGYPRCSCGQPSPHESGWCGQCEPQARSPGFSKIVLAPEAFAKVMEMIESPAAPTEALKALFREKK